MEKKHAVSIWYVLIGIWVVLLVQSYIASMLAVKTIPYSQFMNSLKQGKVTEIAVSQDEIQGKMKNPQGQMEEFKTVRVDPELSKTLEQYNVVFKGKIESTILRDVISWVLPVFIFVGVWYLLMKRMAGQQPGFMSLGKNKAKIYMENELKIRLPMWRAWTRQSRSSWR